MVRQSEGPLTLLAAARRIGERVIMSAQRLCGSAAARSTIRGKRFSGALGTLNDRSFCRNDMQYLPFGNELVVDECAIVAKRLEPTVVGLEKV